MHTHNNSLPHLTGHPNQPILNIRGGHSRFIRKQARYLIKLFSQRKLPSGKQDRFDNFQAVAVLIHRSINASSAEGSQKTASQVPFTTHWFLYEFSSINIRHSLIFPGNETTAIPLFFFPFPGKDFLYLSLLDGGSAAARRGERVPENEDDRVAPEEHLRDVPVLVHRLRLLLALSGLGELGPHLLDALEDHVAVAVEGLHPPQQLLVVPAVDQDLRVSLDGLCEDRGRSGVELLLLLGLQLLGGHLRLGLRECRRRRHGG